MPNIRRQKRSRRSLLKSRTNRPKHVNVFKRINHYQPNDAPRSNNSNYRKYGKASQSKVKKQMMSNSKHQIRNRMVVTNTNEGLRPINRNVHGIGSGTAPDPSMMDYCVSSFGRNDPNCAWELTPGDFIGGQMYNQPCSGDECCEDGGYPPCGDTGGNRGAR